MLMCASGLNWKTASGWRGSPALAKPTARLCGLAAHPPAPPHRFRIEPFDVLLGLAFVAAQYGILDVYRDFYNPENQAIGHDNYAFLSTGVAASSGRWDLYSVDKRPLYGFLINSGSSNT